MREVTALLDQKLAGVLEHIDATVAQAEARLHEELSRVTAENQRALFAYLQAMEQRLMDALVRHEHL